MLAIFVSANPPAGHSADVVTLSFTQQLARQDLDAVLKQIERTTREHVKDFRLLDKGPAKLDGHPARQMVYIGKSENGVDIEATTLFTALDDGRFFSISIVSDPRRHDEFRRIRHDILQSLKIFEPK